MQVAYQIIDIFELWGCFKSKMFIDMYFDTGGTEWKKTSPTTTEVSKQFIIMKGTSNFG
jgi:hypothetical protein